MPDYVSGSATVVVSRLETAPAVVQLDLCVPVYRSTMFHKVLIFPAEALLLLVSYPTGIPS